MEKMFYQCEELKELDLSYLQTSNVIAIKEMFYGCQKLEKLDIRNFENIKCKIFDNMFELCYNLTLFVNTVKAKEIMNEIPYYVKVFNTSNRNNIYNNEDI